MQPGDGPIATATESVLVGMVIDGNTTIPPMPGGTVP